MVRHFPAETLRRSNFLTIRRPAIALLTQGVYGGRDCRTVVAGWQAWWQCQKAAAIDPAVKCDALAEIVKALRKGRGAETPPS
jgi:hypothetical protein